MRTWIDEAQEQLLRAREQKLISLRRKALPRAVRLARQRECMRRKRAGEQAPTYRKAVSELRRLITKGVVTKEQIMKELSL